MTIVLKWLGILLVDFHELFDKSATLYIIISFKYNINLSVLYYLFVFFKKTEDKHA